MRAVATILFLTACLAVAPAISRAQDSAASDPTTASEWNPLQANKDLEVGSFYLKKKNYDAAIDRFKEAARLHPGLARPYLMLGETYEKKKDLKTAVASYRKYLELYRAAPDKKKVQKRIDKLEKQIALEAARSRKP
jgi:tetratricopeptide (TPR) repeat protein